jgi:DNA-binding MarR family transcriptional regulator
MRIPSRGGRRPRPPEAERQEPSAVVASRAEARREEMALDLFELVTQLGLTAPRGRRRAEGLKEVEYLTLAALQDRGTMIVGDIQRLLGVLPAQMSRIIRALESRPASLVACRINPRDKRKVDVCLTDFGRKALLDYQLARVGRIAALLRDLPDEDQERLSHVLDKLRGLWVHHVAG